MAVMSKCHTCPPVLGMVSQACHIGDRVRCSCGELATEEGTIVAQDYHAYGWDEGVTVPFLVELDNSDLVPLRDEAFDFWEITARSHEQHPAKSTFDSPGVYLVVRNTWITSAAQRASARQVADLFPPSTLEVLEVRAEGDRVRGRVAEGWISLRSTDDEKVFAVPTGSAYARLFREANPGLFHGQASIALEVFVAVALHMPVASKRPASGFVPRAVRHEP
eukprot:CAMPEP_0171063542 /NCGR_PEP_ID=MMETSP0766_2-20121228/5724_1 /TAXON_ID=439317 /ORGANISM="Gambierdiscus australes, Strain CAWD 149" /LENGTH=220 /DNA_ID=CAMNT_0011519471 /DNA_START=18 /DNA_END=681 /DNA_ORIENTATION=+